MNDPLFVLSVFGKELILTPWKLIGLVGVCMFTGRWFVQMYYSRKAGKPVTPRLFWVLSMVGSVIVLTYFVFSAKQDMVGIVSNLFPCVVAAYNLYLDLTHSKRLAAAAQAAAGQ
jgi:lipid-A-disaccharide synthase-like uncharacterized protein